MQAKVSSDGCWNSLIFPRILRECEGEYKRIKRLFPRFTESCMIKSSRNVDKIKLCIPRGEGRGVIKLFALFLFSSPSGWRKNGSRDESRNEINRGEEWGEVIFPLFFSFSKFPIIFFFLLSRNWNTKEKRNTREIIRRNKNLSTSVQGKIARIKILREKGGSVLYPKCNARMKVYAIFTNSRAVPIKRIPGMPGETLDIS